MKNIYICLFLAIAVFGLCGCSGDDYLNAVPKESTAIIKIDVANLGSSGLSVDKSKNIMQALLGTSDVTQSGIDLQSPLYMFETPDGSFGLVAKVDDDDNLSECLKQQAQRGKCTAPQKRRDVSFTVLNGSWMAGFNDDAFLIIGPALPNQQSDMMRAIMKYLSAGVGIKETPIYNKVEEIDKPITMVARASALPTQLMAPFTIGAPQNADPSDVLIAASMTSRDGNLLIEGKTFSFDESINKALQEAMKTYNPIGDTYLENIPDGTLLSVLMNVDGEKYIKLLQQNKSMTALLAGVNAAIDLDNIIRSVRGNMVIAIPALSASNIQLMWGAQLAKKDFLRDISYWKQSVPQGARIDDRGFQCWHYAGGDTGFFFGVSADNQFYMGGDEQEAKSILKPAVHPINAELRQLIKGRKLCLVLNIGGISHGDDTAGSIMQVFKPLFGNVNSIVFCLKE